MCRSIGFQCIRPFELCGKEPPDLAYVSSSPSKIPYGGFSPVRLQTGYEPWRPSPASPSAVSVRHASAPNYRPLIRHHSPSAGTPMVLSDKITGSIARTLQSSGPWLASGLCCPTGSSLTMAASEPLGTSADLFVFVRRIFSPLVLFGVVPERFPNLLCMSFSPCRLQYPVDQEGAFDYFFPSRIAFASFAMARHPNIHAIRFVVVG